MSAVFKLLTGAILISFSAVFVKMVQVEPTASAFYRVFFGGVILFVFAFVQQRKIPMKGTLLLLTALCGFIFAADLGLWHQSIHFVGPGLATILGNLQVFFLVGAGVLIYREQVNVRFILALTITLAGLFLIFGRDWGNLQPDYKIGIYLGLGTAFCYALYVLVLRHLQSYSRSISPAMILAQVSLFAALFLAIISVMQGQSLALSDGRDTSILILYGLSSQVVGWMLISRALPNVEVSLAGLILLLQPGLSFLWDVLFFQRPTGFLEVIGIGVAFTGIYLGTLARANLQSPGTRTAN
ncbi:MAG: EamA family transporter [Candidatus Marinimicrobia bacterium]|nr:EamA family transporter [Candidatus Neomarinimicrobiota bacterium]